LLAGLALVLALAGYGPAWGQPRPSDTTGSAPVLINEVQYDPEPSGPDADWEWFEIYVATDTAISLSGWSVSDNSATTPLPDITISPHSFLVIAATDKFLELFPGFTGEVVYMPDGKIGNGLSNSGDRLVLLDDQGMEVDSLSWGTDTSVFDPPCPDVASGHSLERVPWGHDTDQADDFVDQENPTPGWLVAAAQIYLPLVVSGNGE
jgi:hypothetical protein